MNPPVKVVLCGPPQSGKSCLREGLKQAIRRIPNAPYPLIITANPDGEGSWFAQTVQRNPDEATLYKTAYKTKFTTEFAVVRAEWVKNCKQPLALIDVGGRISEENKLIMQHGTHAVILAGDMTKVNDWLGFCLDLQLKIIGVIHSDLYSKVDKITSISPIITGSIHCLQRGEDVSGREMVQTLAEFLVRMCKV
jgi:CRISPR-associated protein Csx3